MTAGWMTEGEVKDDETSHSNTLTNIPDPSETAARRRSDTSSRYQRDVVQINGTCTRIRETASRHYPHPEAGILSKK